MAAFRQVTIVGVGLIGGSLGMAIRHRRVAVRVVGYSRKRSTLRQAKARGALDVGTTRLRAAVEDADVVVLATPVDLIVPLARRVAPWMRCGSILTDVGSTKAEIVRALDRALPRHLSFIGGHPLVGSEQRGIAAATSSFFAHSACILTPTSGTDAAALRRVRRLWQGIGSRVLTISPQRHDRLLAGTSHLPHLLAACLVQSVALGPLPRAPQSLLDMTRIAASDPDLWDDIVLSNRAALLAAMNHFERHWRILRRHVVRGDRVALRRFMTKAKSIRDALETH